MFSQVSEVRKFSAQDWRVTFILVVFCAIMTFLLVRNEYFPETSLFNKLPPRLIADRFLKGDATSSLKLVWKGETVGGVMIRVTPGKKPFIKSSTQFEMPILGKRPKASLDMECKLLANHDVERFRLRGHSEEARFEILVDAPSNKLEVAGIGYGVNEKRTYALSDFTRDRGRAILKQLPKLPGGFSIPTEFPKTNLGEGWRVTASLARVSRLGDWMDAYLLHVRADANSWIKLWMSPTGEILKLESSFGLSALNEDFYEGMSKISSKS